MLSAAHPSVGQPDCMAQCFLGGGMLHRRRCTKMKAAGRFWDLMITMIYKYSYNYFKK